MGAVLIGRMALATWILLQAGLGARADATPAAEPKRFQATLERPLFSPTRRAPPAPVVSPLPMAPPMVAPPPPPPPPPPSVTLSGVIVGGKGGIALLQRGSDPAAVRVAVGADVDGWTVSEIHPRAVVLQRDGRTATVELPTPPR